MLLYNVQYLKARVIISRILASGGRISLRKVQGILRLSQTYGNDRLEAACLRAVSYDNYTYEAISNILKNKLDQYSIPNIEGGKVKNIKANA